MKLNPIVLFGTWDIVISGGEIDIPFKALGMSNGTGFIASPVPERLVTMTQERFEKSWDNANRWHMCTIKIMFDQRNENDLPNWVDPDYDWMVYKSIKWEAQYLGGSVNKKIYAIPPRKIDISTMSDEELERRIDYAFSNDSCQCGEGDCCGRTPMFVNLGSIKRESNGMVSFKIRGSQHV